MAQVVALREDTHTYTVDGVVRPGVTDIIWSLGAEKRAKAPSASLEAAADRGHRVHEYCQLYDYDALPDFIEQDCVGYVEAYLRFMRDFRVRWYHSELMLGSAMFAGTIDRDGEIAGELAIADLKCTAALDRKTVAAQLYGYGKLYIWNGYSEVMPKLYPVWLKKDGTYKAEPLTQKEFENGREAFKNCLWNYRYLKGEFDV